MFRSKCTGLLMQVMYILDVSFHDISPSKYPELVFKTSEESPVLMTISISLRLNGKGWFRRSIHPTCLRTNFPPYVRVGSRYHFPSHGLGLLTSRERWWNRMNSFQTDLFTETTPLVSSPPFLKWNPSLHSPRILKKTSQNGLILRTKMKYTLLQTQVQTSSFSIGPYAPADS